MILKSVFCLVILSPKFLSVKSIENSSLLPQQWSDRDWKWEDWYSTTNTSMWSSFPDIKQYFDKIDISFEKFVDEMKKEYRELSTEVRGRVNRDIEYLKELKKRMKGVMEENLKVVSSYDWKLRLNETKEFFDVIKAHGNRPESRIMKMPQPNPYMMPTYLTCDSFSFDSGLKPVFSQSWGRVWTRAWAASTQQ